MCLRHVGSLAFWDPVSIPRSSASAGRAQPRGKAPDLDTSRLDRPEFHSLQEKQPAPQPNPCLAESTARSESPPSGPEPPEPAPHDARWGNRVCPPLALRPEPRFQDSKRRVR
jgi:hypothetical protein